MFSEISINDRVNLLSELSDSQKESLILPFKYTVLGNNFNLLLWYGFSEKKLDLLLGKSQSIEIKERIRDLYEKYTLMKKMSHFMGISGKNNIFDSENLGFKLSGWTAKPSLDAFKDVLNAYEPSDNFKDEWSEIKEAFNFIKLDASLDDIVMQNYERINGNPSKLLIIPSGWPKHSITLAVKDNFLIVANRGQGFQSEGGCIIYKLNRPLSEDDIRVLIKKENKEIVEGTINELTNHRKSFFQGLPLKPQKYGTCAIANKKAVVSGLLTILNYIKSSKEISESIADTVMLSTREEYKNFTDFARERVLDESISILNAPVAMNQNEIMDTLADFINDHPDINKPSELKQLKKIASRLSDENFELLIPMVSPQGKCILSWLKNAPNLEPPKLLQSAFNSYHNSLIGGDALFEIIYSLQTLNVPDQKNHSWFSEYFFFFCENQEYEFLASQLRNVEKMRYDHSYKGNISFLLSKLISLDLKDQSYDLILNCARIMLDKIQESDRIHFIRNHLNLYNKKEALDVFSKMFSQGEIHEAFFSAESFPSKCDSDFIAVLSKVVGEQNLSIIIKKDERKALRHFFSEDTQNFSEVFDRVEVNGPLIKSLFGQLSSAIDLVNRNSFQYLSNMKKN